MVHQIENKTETQAKIAIMLSLLLKVPASNIHPYTHFMDDLHLDDVDRLLLIVELERLFNVFLSTEEVETIETVEDASMLMYKYAVAA